MLTDEVASFLNENYADVGIQVQGKSKTRLRVSLPQTVPNIADIIVKLSTRYNAECTLDQEGGELELHVYPTKTTFRANRPAAHYLFAAVVLALAATCFMFMMQ